MAVVGVRRDVVNQWSLRLDNREYCVCGRQAKIAVLCVGQIACINTSPPSENQLRAGSA